MIKNNLESGQTDVITANATKTAAQLEIVYRSLEWFQPYERNPRKNDKAIDRMEASIREYGFTVPVLALSSGLVVDGHLRLKAAPRINWLTSIPTILCDGWTEAQVKGFRLMVNRSVTWAIWDAELLATEFGDLKEMGFELPLTGFDLREIDLFTAQVNPEEEAAPPVPLDPVSKIMDVWVLGRHRVLCGDSTKTEHVFQLGTGLADLVFTDPPYGVSYDGGTTVQKKLPGDHNANLYSTACFQAAAFSKSGAALYLWHADIKGMAAASAATASGYEIRSQIIWNKNLAQFGSLTAQYKPKHESCFYCVRRGKPPAWYGPKNEVTVWDANRSAVNEFHPTQKPVEIVERAIRNSSKAGDIVLDLFGGSGSTLIGCHQTERIARLVEIDPGYCDVIVGRWQNLYGQQATLAGDGRTFGEIAVARKTGAMNGS